MNCGRVSNQLSAYIDRELTGIEMLQVRAHLDRCDRCCAEHEALIRMKMMLGRLQTVEPPQKLVSQMLRRFEASGPWVGAPRLGASSRRSPEGRIRTGFLGGRLTALPVHARFSRIQGGASHLLGLIPWQPVSLGFTATVLALALIFTSVIRHRQADMTVASTPTRVRQGMDPLGADWPPGDSSLRPGARDPFLGGDTSLHWVTISLEGGTSWPSH